MKKWIITIVIQVLVISFLAFLIFKPVVSTAEECVVTEVKEPSWNQVTAIIDTSINNNVGRVMYEYIDANNSYKYIDYPTKSFFSMVDFSDYSYKTIYDNEDGTYSMYVNNDSTATPITKEEYDGYVNLVLSKVDLGDVTTKTGYEEDSDDYTYTYLFDAEAGGINRVVVYKSVAQITYFLTDYTLNITYEF